MEMGKTISSIALIILFISAMANAQTTHTVGGNAGWTTGQNYDSWASGETFTAGDTLSFAYGPSHDVAEVNQDDYDNCAIGNLISVDRSSPTRITLSAPGTRYFICSLSNHCSARGMKVTVTVSAATTTPSPPTGATPSPPSSTTPSPPSSTTTPPSSTTPSTPTPTPTSRTTPPPPAGGAASSLGARSGLVAGGLSVILAAVML